MSYSATGTVKGGVVALLLLGVLVGCGEIRPGSRGFVVYHTVEPGETLYSIAWRHDRDWRQVAAWNKLRSPYTIHPGQRLTIIPPSGYQGPRPARDVASTGGPGGAARQPAPLSPSVASVPPTRRPPAAQPSAAPLADLQTPAVGAIDWKWPVTGEIVRGFSETRGKGIDIAGELGQAVRAAAAGEVVYSGDGLIGYGNLIIVMHDEHYLSAYAHNRNLLVAEGRKVRQGEQIAEMGQTAGGKTILHFEIRQDGKPVDPLHFLPKQLD